MKKQIKRILVLGLFLILFSCSSSQISTTNKKQILNKSEIETVTAYKNGYVSLVKRANKTLEKKFRSITDKEIEPPSGDKHDYYSRAIYYWSDSTSKKWKFVDGKVNKKSLEKTDHFTFFEAMGAIRDLSLAFQFNDDEKYAVKAFQIIDQWFVDNNTKMNPNFNYSQAIPGKSDGSHWGIISSRAIVWVIYGIDLLKHSDSFDSRISKEFKDWCSNYLQWLINSDFGIAESNTKNNHETFYDLQVAELAHFTDDHELCKNVLKNVRDVRIVQQIKNNGSMPAELKRTKPIHYSLFNLSAFFHLAKLGDKYKLNLWEAKTDTSGSIIDAFNFTLEQIDRVSKTKKDDINYSYVIGLLTVADTKFKNRYNNELNILLSENKKIRLVDIYFSF